MSQMDINAVLAQMRTMATQAQTFQAEAPSAAATGDFQALMTKALDQVNETQKTAGNLAQRFEQGDSNVDISQVMISLQKADVSFQAISQVRNRLVSAYQDIMNMPI